MNKICFYSLGVLVMLYSLNSYSQNFTYAKVAIVSATFSGGNLTIRKDEGGNYTAPQWKAANTVQSPVAYVSGNKPTVAASFTIDCARVPDSVFIRGVGSDSINFISTKVVVASSTNTVHNIFYPAKAGSKTFASGVVRFFKPFTINWEISFDKGITWKLIGASQNTLYVTRSTPQPEGTEYKWFHTVFDLSCRNAKYQTADTSIIQQVWNEFTDHVVLNYKDDSLHYYKPMNTVNVSLGDLLFYRNAQCYTYAQLFLAAIKIQGVIRTNNYVNITPNNKLACGYTVNRFIVKDWTFGTPTAASKCPEFPYENTYTTLIPSPYTSYGFTTQDVSDQAGIPGSCSVNPSSYFNNHQVAKIDGKYYDPCYGVTFNSLSAIKTAAFSGWSYRYTSGSITYAYFTNDLSKADLTETITTF